MKLVLYIQVKLLYVMFSKIKENILNTFNNRFLNYLELYHFKKPILQNLLNFLLSFYTYHLHYFISFFISIQITKHKNLQTTLEFTT